MDGHYDSLHTICTQNKRRASKFFNYIQELIGDLANAEDDLEVSYREMDLNICSAPDRLQNRQHDEVWYPDPADHSSNISTPENKPLDHPNSHPMRTVIGAMPPSAELIEIYALIDQYVPAAVELPTKFRFPGPLAYFPAVHAPDPILSPPPPGPIPKLQVTSEASIGAVGSIVPRPPNAPSMFVNFLRTAHESTSPRTPRVQVPVSEDDSGFIPRPPLTARAPGSELSSSSMPFVRRSSIVDRSDDSNKLPTRLLPMSTSTNIRVPQLNLKCVDHENPLTYYLRQANDALLMHKSALISRPLRLPRVADTFIERTGGLDSALQDPSWNMCMPSRVDLVEQSLANRKLNYNVVKKERKKDIPTWMTAREYKAELIIKPTKAETISSGSMNDKGTLLATTHYDMTCKIWKADTGELVHNLQGHTNHLSDCVWNSPYSTKVITSSFDKTLKVWDVQTGREIHTLVGHELEVVCVATSPNGLLCASGGMDDIAIIWDIELGTEKFNLMGHEGEVIALDFSPCGEKLVTGSMDESVRVWNVANGSQLHKFEGHTAEVNQVKFNCFGNMIVSGSIDTTCRLWDVATGESKLLKGHTHEVVDCDFSPDGWTCASASDDTTIRIWDVLTGGCIMLLVGHTEGVCRLMYTPDGSALVSGSLDSTARVWNVGNGECRQVLSGHKGLVIASYNASTNRIITMSRDNTCRLWKLEEPHSNLTGMSALAVSRSPETYKDILDRRLVPPNLLSLLQNFFEKVHKDRERELGVLTKNTTGAVSLDAQEDERQDEVTQVLNLRGNQRTMNISRLDEIRVE
eukprot:GILJ01016811.1.p1 GENE.GILJ01016811.1~~GILJ01016811.1.p1  ORF type:complete len:805 (+),score=60.31 GILJ01016811.1:3-2417(+)